MHLFLIILLYTNVIVSIAGGQAENSQKIHAGEYGTYSLKLRKYDKNLPLRQGSKLDRNYSGQYTITEIRHKSGVLYRCNGKNYKNPNDALECLSGLKKKYPRVILIIPQHLLKPKPPTHPKPTFKPPRYPKPQQNPSIRPPNLNKFKHFDIRRFLSTDRYSNRIYKSIWSKCNYSCFYRNNYKMYKVLALKQINLLRKYHRVKPLKENYYLDILAQNYADKMARRGTEFYLYSSLYGIVTGSIYFPAGSVLVTHWYDERFHYKFGSNRPVYRTQRLTQMLWKGTRFFGIGVAANGDYIYVSCYFYEKGNINGRYKKNVFNKRFWHRFRG
uniref:CAP domain-containing protein (inferred by orthology to a zebrafish protein) n=1 Tax=Strongyloides venezuelensis TaxID=75913 RepID=A0A0K0G1Z7_STRVS